MLCVCNALCGENRSMQRSMHIHMQHMDVIFGQHSSLNSPSNMCMAVYEAGCRLGLRRTLRLLSERITLLVLGVTILLSYMNMLYI